jgi:hypothetical protein
LSTFNKQQQKTYQGIGRPIKSDLATTFFVIVVQGERERSPPLPQITDLATTLKILL